MNEYHWASFQELRVTVESVWQVTGNNRKGHFVQGDRPREGNFESELERMRKRRKGPHPDPDIAKDLDEIRTLW